MGNVKNVYDVGVVYSHDGILYIAVNVEILPAGVRRGVASAGTPPRLFTWEKGAWVGYDIVGASPRNNMSILAFRRALGITSEQLAQLQKKYFELPLEKRDTSVPEDKSGAYRGEKLYRHIRPKLGVKNMA